MGAVRGLLLDVGGVLVVPAVTPVQEALAETGVTVSEGDLDRAFATAVTRLTQPFETAGDELLHHYVEGFVAALGIETPKPVVREAITTAFRSHGSMWPRIVPGAREAIRALTG